MATLAAPYEAIPHAAMREQMIARYTPLARRAVAPFIGARSSVMEAEDIESCAMMGLIDAVDRYDGSRGVKFESYAATRIRGFVQDEMRALDWMPRSARGNVRLLLRTAEQLEAALGRSPIHEEIAQASGLAPELCSRAIADADRRVVSLDALCVEHDEGSSACLAQHIEDPHSANPATALESHELRQGLFTALTNLPEREGNVLRLRYIDQLTHRQIAVRLAISESRVSQLHARGLARMRESLLATFNGPSMAQRSA